MKSLYVTIGAVNCMILFLILMIADKTILEVIQTYSVEMWKAMFNMSAISIIRTISLVLAIVLAIVDIILEKE